MRPVLHLHVGHPKTATSYIQAKLHMNEVWLAGRGIFVPGDFRFIAYYYFSRIVGKSRATPGNASYIYYAIAEPYTLKVSDIARYWDYVFGEAAGRDVFLSSELLFYAPPKVFACIREECERRGYDIHLIAYVSRQDHSAVGTYVQNVKNHGYFKTAIDFLHETRSTNLLNYHSSISAALDSLRPARVDVRIFDPRFILDGDVWRDLCSLGLNQMEDAPVNPTGLVNAGPGVHAIEMVRAINQLAASGTVSTERAKALRRAVLDSSSAVLDKRDVRKCYYTSELRSMLVHLFAEENARLLKDFFHDVSGAEEYWTLFPEAGEDGELPYDADQLRSLVSALLSVGGIIPRSVERLFRRIWE